MPEVITKSMSRNRASKSEPEYCGVCMSNYTAIIRKKCVCKYCKSDTCSKCIERYLIERNEDAHCLHCRVNYNDTTLLEICTKTYLKNTYFKHRQEILINKERANLPGLQSVAVEVRASREAKTQIKTIKDNIIELNELLNKKMDEKLLNAQDYIGGRKSINVFEMKLSEINQEIKDIKEAIQVSRNSINDIYNKFNILIAENAENTGNIENMNTLIGIEEKRKFIRRCTRDNCQGFLSTAWKCGICEYYSCSKCFKTKTKIQDDPHECQKEDIETANLIKKDSKPCPNCGEFIMKSSGCFAKDTPILLFDGTKKLSQEISFGDELMGDDFEKRTVLDITNGIDMMYLVEQNDGNSYIVNSKHTLVLKYNSRLQVNSHIYNKLNYYRTGDFQYHIIVSDYIKLDKEVQSVLVGYTKSTQNIIEPEIESEITVREYGMGEYYGWKVDGNNRFLLNNGIVVRNCSQMFCITCQTPWDWNTGKIVVSGPIHNPHYYEWVNKTKEGGTPRNPADVPCGGFPNIWELVRMPKGVPFIISGYYYEFHRLCQDLQDISERNYRSHIDNTTTTNINVKFLLGDYDEKKWGQMLAKNERKRKRDSEIQEIFAAFRMVAVELINRIQNYQSDDGIVIPFKDISAGEAEKCLIKFKMEVNELIDMINVALRNVSISFSYSVPYITNDTPYYSIKTKNFESEVKKIRCKREKKPNAGAGNERDNDTEEGSVTDTVDDI